MQHATSPVAPSAPPATLDKNALLQHAAWIAGGAAALGALSGLDRGLPDMLDRAMSLPLVFVVEALVLMPALYIGSALLGLSPRLDLLMRAGSTTLGDIGRLLLGLTPALALTIATAQSPRTGEFVALCALALGALLGLHRFYKLVFGEVSRPEATLPLFIAWSIPVLGIGLHQVGRALGLPF
jgi:hypothetical protein